MSFRLKHLYPFLFAVIPILNVVSRNPGYIARGDMVSVLACVLAGCALIYVVLVGITGWSVPIGSWLLGLGVLAFYGLLPLVVSLLGSLGKIGGAAVLLLVLAGIGLASWRLLQRPHWLDRVASFLTLSACLVVLSLSTQILVHGLRARATIQHSALAKRLAQPVGVRSDQARQAGSPDIYLLLLDEYANANVLQERFNFDNRAFEDSLRQLGFTIPQSVRSNYAHTLLSLPSLLNFSHLTEITSEVGHSATDASLPNYLLSHNRTAAFLKRLGYKFLFFPSEWWPATQHNPMADQEYQAWTGLNLGRELSRSHFRRTLVRMTLLKPFVDDAKHDTEHIRRTLDALKKVPANPEPTFVFAHFLSPHYPYVFQADCRPVPQGKSQGKRIAYVQQLRCLNHLVLATVTSLLKTSPTPPVILLQGDHGTSTLNFSWAPTAAAVSPAQARERFGAFGAYYLPSGGNRLLADSVTLVNVFQRVLSYYFGADAAASGDQLYMSLEQRPYDFVAVDPERLKVAASPVSR